jgi:hypothetical protein
MTTALHVVTWLALAAGALVVVLFLLGRTR